MKIAQAAHVAVIAACAVTSLIAIGYAGVVSYEAGAIGRHLVTTPAMFQARMISIGCAVVMGMAVAIGKRSMNRISTAA